MYETVQWCLSARADRGGGGWVVELVRLQVYVPRGYQYELSMKGSGTVQITMTKSNELNSK